MNEEPKKENGVFIHTGGTIYEKAAIKRAFTSIETQPAKRTAREIVFGKAKEPIKKFKISVMFHDDHTLESTYDNKEDRDKDFERIKNALLGLPPAASPILLENISKVPEEIAKAALEVEADGKKI